MHHTLCARERTPHTLTYKRISASVPLIPPRNREYHRHAALLSVTTKRNLYSDSKFPPTKNPYTDIVLKTSSAQRTSWPAIASRPSHDNQYEENAHCSSSNTGTCYRDGSDPFNTLYRYTEKKRTVLLKRISIYARIQETMLTIPFVIKKRITPGT